MLFTFKIGIISKINTNIRINVLFMEWMMKENRHIISKVLPGSIAEELELEPGDILVSVNGQTIEDVFDYR